MKSSRLFALGLSLLTGRALALAPNHPVADAHAVVRVGHARFTVLTPTLIRMEYAPDDHFENRASFFAVDRAGAPPPFKVHKAMGALFIDTGTVSLRYSPATEGFTAGSLRISFHTGGLKGEWRPGQANNGNLGGTIRTLDQTYGPRPIDPGLLSRDGWFLLDDSKSFLFTDAPKPWIAVRQPRERLDWYFFAYGRDYKHALKDLIRVSGPIPLPPEFALGSWYSRYWAYTDAEMRDVVRGYRSRHIPLDVMVVDMDWHTPPHWGGYTWNKELFPDPAGFLRWLHQQGLKTTLNVHPANGVESNEETYPQMARLMGIDPSTRQTVPFDAVDPKYMLQGYFDTLLHPQEKMGVDFWWLDWQQGDTTKLPGVDPLPWMNYLHFRDSERNGRRGLIYSRWGGFGNQRYPAEFSGDTASQWNVLDFEFPFTADAANVGADYWGHDLGGHLMGTIPGDLYTRWIEFGAFSPMLRVHSNHGERRPWAFSPEVERIATRFWRLRSALMPYIYTAARNTTDTGIALCRPMYMEWPNQPNAYKYDHQYMYGPDMFVAPIADPGIGPDHRAAKRVWFPPGTWSDWFTGAVVKGPAERVVSAPLSRIPVFVRAGAPIPMQEPMDYVGQKPLDPLVIRVAAGASGSSTLYEDDETSVGYRNGKFARTHIAYTETANKAVMIVGPEVGSFPGRCSDGSCKYSSPAARVRSGWWSTVSRFSPGSTALKP